MLSCPPGWFKDIFLALLLVFTLSAGAPEVIATGPLNYRISGISNAVGAPPAQHADESPKKCYIALKHNEPKLIPPPHSPNSTTTADDEDTISARMLTVDPLESLDRVVTLDNGKDCKIAVLLQVRECRFQRQNLPSTWNLQMSPAFKKIFSTTASQDPTRPATPPTLGIPDAGQLTSESNPKSETEMEQPTTGHPITYKGSGCQSDYYIQLYGPITIS